MTVKRSQLRDPEKEKFPMMKEKKGEGEYKSWMTSRKKAVTH